MTIDRTGSTSTQSNSERRRPLVRVLGWTLTTVILLALLWIVYLLLKPVLAGLVSPGQKPPTVLLLGIAFAVGTLILLAALVAFAFVGREIDGDGDDVRGALSLPHGSISAVLALIILVVFSLSSIHVFSEIRAGEDGGIQSRGVTQEALAALPDDRILAVVAEPIVEGQPPTYVVTLSNPHENSTDFASELMTIFSTLLIAIVGFYFGQGATAAGVREATKTARSPGGQKGALSRGKAKTGEEADDSPPADQVQ